MCGAGNRWETCVPASPFSCESKALLKMQSLGGFPGGAVVKESACQCRGHGFEPWSGKIPHAAEQLSP